MTEPLLKVVAIGPESTGKSSLSEALAHHYDTIHCPEYARSYLLQHGRDYTFDNLLDIAKGQLELEKEYARQAIEKWNATNHPKTKRPILFIDTDMYVMKIWCEFVFGDCHTWILDKIVEQHYDLYLLCHTDIPWVQDELREYPDPETREQLFHMYHDILIHQSIPWTDIKGTYQHRITLAIQAVDRLLGKME